MKERELNRHWKKILNTMSEGLMVIGNDGVILTVNQAFERLTGYEAREVLGRRCTILGCDACETSLLNRDGCWCRLFEQGRDVRKRCTVLRKDGTCVPVLKNASLLRDEAGEPYGAVETLTDLAELDRLDEERTSLTRQLEGEEGFHGLVGRSRAMARVFHLLERAAQSEAPILLYGESGTGKELAARAIHELGRRREGPFVQCNCAALNEALLESELFGHTKGAFTGAYRHRIGRFEAAHGGDIFLDEIGDLPLSIQVKLLRVLETRQIERVGDHRALFVDVRIVTATNKDLQTLMTEKRFREDLFFRIHVIPIELPPLRQRAEDIPYLVNTFIARLQKRTGKEIMGLSPEALETLMAYPFPGNVRELKSALEYAFVLADRGPIGREHLPPSIRDGPWKETEPHPQGQSKEQEPGEKAALLQALRNAGGNQSEAARMLGVNRGTVWSRMRKYGIDLRKTVGPGE